MGERSLNFFSSFLGLRALHTNNTTVVLAYPSFNDRLLEKILVMADIEEDESNKTNLAGEKSWILENVLKRKFSTREKSIILGSGSVTSIQIAFSWIHR